MNTCGDVLEALSIACDCDMLAYDYDPYEYWNAIDGQTEALALKAVRKTAKDILGKPEDSDYLIEYLQSIISETCDMEYIARASQIYVRLAAFHVRREKERIAAKKRAK